MSQAATVTIKDKKTQAILASAPKPDQVMLFEGAWYFDQEYVDMTNLVVTKRIYTCPYKGRCYWIDLKAPGHKAQNVAWTYFEVKNGYEFIQDKIAFYGGEREATIEE